MVTELEELVEGKKVLLDNSYTQPGDSLAKRLYDGLWRSVEESDIKRKMERVSEIEGILSKDFFVIEESKIEMKESLTQLNAHLEYFDNKNKHYHNENKYHKRSYKKTRGSWGNESRESFNLYLQYVNNFFSLFRRLRNREPRKRFTEQQNSFYQTTFNIAQIRSRDFNNLLNDRKLENYKNPLLIGQTLQTDQKIIATAFTLAFESPVLILTRDKGFKKMFKRVLDCINNPEEYHRYRVNSLPKHQVILYGIEHSNCDETRPIFAYQPEITTQTFFFSSFPISQ